MTVFRRGEIVLVAFPFTDLTSAKMRPALVVSSDVFPAEDQKQAGLPKLSLVKIGKIVTLDQRLIRKKPGRLPDPTLSLLTLKLHKLLQ